MRGLAVGLFILCAVSSFTGAGTNDGVLVGVGIGLLVAGLIAFVWEDL